MEVHPQTHEAVTAPAVAAVTTETEATTIETKVATTTEVEIVTTTIEDLITTTIEIILIEIPIEMNDDSMIEIMIEITVMIITEPLMIVGLI